MPQPNIPTVPNNAELDELRGIVGRMSRNLKYLLTNLDSTNVIEAKTVISDWVYANEIVANQITSGTMTGITIQTNVANNNRIVLTNNTLISYNASNQKNGVQINGGSDMQVYDSGSLIGTIGHYLSGNPALTIGSGYNLNLSCNNTYLINLDGNTNVEGNVSITGTLSTTGAITMSGGKAVATQDWVENDATIVAKFG